MIIKNFKLVTENEIVNNSYLEINGENIVDVGINYVGNADIDLKGKYLLPGFIDIHSHGGYSCDVMNNTENDVNTILKNIVKEGVTSFVATTLTQDFDVLLNVCKICYELRNSKIGASLVGIHLEGPFINHKYKGAQNPEFITTASTEAFDTFCEVAPNFIKLLTYAPELASVEFTKHIRNKNCVASIGHSDARLETVREHFDNGLNSVTHFHNAMSAHDQFVPGVITAGFLLDINVEIIVDGIHIHRDVIDLIYKVKGSDRITLITDSMEAKGMPDGDYDLGGLAVVKTGDSVKTEEGLLAGSVLTYDKAVKNMIEFTDCPLTDIVKMTSVNQAKMLKLDKVGYIEKGYFADLVCLDEHYDVCYTVCKGEIKYKRNEYDEV